MNGPCRALRLVAAACLLAGTLCASAHELEASRATVVLREPGLVSLALHVDYMSLLQQSLAPRDSVEQFLFTAAAMPPEKFRDALERTQRALQAGTQLRLPGGRTQAFARWVWPDAARVQGLLRERVMQQVTASAQHPADATLEIQAEVLLPTAVASLRLQLPAALGRVLVVWYRPGQQWVEPGTVSAEMKFR